MDAKVEAWRLKKTIERLGAYRSSSNATSLVSLLMPGNYQIALANALLTEEFGTASNIRSRVTRQDVLSAITSAQHKLKLYPRLPKNGLAIYSGHIADGKAERKVTIAFEPVKPIESFKYLCDTAFYTAPLIAMLDYDEVYGFLVVSGTEAVYATLSGQHKTVLCRIAESLPKKHNKGGQSSVRFARLRLEAIHNYIRKVCELATQVFIKENAPTVKGLILAGTADLKEQLSKSDLFDPRLKKVVLKIVDVAYSGTDGLSQAIELSADALQNVRLLEEKRLIGRFFDAIATNEGDATNYCFGWTDAKAALDMGAVDVLLVWERLPDPCPAELVADLPEDEKPESLVDWLVLNSRRFGADVEIVSDSSEQGHQFCKGFGGLGALLRYPVDFTRTAAADDGEKEDFDDFI